jgi:hypothetical protein
LHIRFSNHANFTGSHSLKRFRTALIAVFFLTPGLASGQNSGFPDVSSLATQIAAGKDLYYLAYTFADARFPPKSPSDAVELLKKEIDTPPVRASKEEIAVLKDREDRMGDILRSLPTVSNEARPQYLCDEFLSPVRVARKDSALCIVFCGLVAKTTYNTHGSSPIMRAQKVAQSMLLPSLRSLGIFASDTALGYVGVVVYYPTRDSTSKNAASAPEMLLVVVSCRDCIAYASGNISASEILNRSDVYLSDIEMSTGVRKINIALP